ncbi:hypothetical protein SUVZ_15G0020 [Saccharomyces uvarum]|uniref:Uncharacterized protein n=1 Tax=Saccharomyces uvarum TaxID=230603 RepID=A0ABN8WP06_SACUV|nr:hypothetical protein SUVZ_15G0020 [Saccharomyces uvarum]
MGKSVVGITGAIPILGYGNIDLGCIKLTNVAYVPDLPFNLISIKQAARNANINIRFSNDAVYFITSNNRAVEVGQSKDGLYCLNCSTSSSSTEVAMLGNTVDIDSSITKHINLRYHYIRNVLKEGIVKLEYVGTKDQLADITTKVLPRQCFESIAKRIMQS